MISSSTGIPPKYKGTKYMCEAYGIGIIGGADGPTAIFVTGGFPWKLFLFVVVSALATIWFFKQKK